VQRRVSRSRADLRRLRPNYYPVIQEHGMPMRGELPISGMCSNIEEPVESGVLEVIGFCLIGLAVTMYFAVSATPLDQIPLLIEQANLW
jgi:hypothetical protein